MRNDFAHPPSSNMQTESKTDYAGVYELWASEKCLKNCNADVVRRLSQYFEPSAQMLEFGAGIGTLATIWNARTGVKPECLEIDPKLRVILTERGFTCFDTLKSITKSFDGVYTSNVLEHIEDDTATLREIRSVLKQQALLAIFVPAFKSLYSGLDVSVGHYRRYDKKDLLKKLELANFDVVDCYYVDSLGFFASLAVKILGYKDGVKLGNDKTFEIFDKYIYPISTVLDRLGLKYLFGKNLLVIAKKRD